MLGLELARDDGVVGSVGEEAARAQSHAARRSLGKALIGL